ncbi:MAG: hypothetical protein ACRD2P_17445 [Terriglobia bacterium]
MSQRILYSLHRELYFFLGLPVASAAQLGRVLLTLREIAAGTWRLIP